MVDIVCLGQSVCKIINTLEFRIIFHRRTLGWTKGLIVSMIRVNDRGISVLDTTCNVCSVPTFPIVHLCDRIDGQN